jgi:hypothetical protein
VSNAWKTVLKATEKHTQARNSERSDGVRGIIDTDTPRTTAHTLVNEFVSVLYPCHSHVQLYRPTSVVEMVVITIDVIRNNHSSTESFLIMLLHLGYLTEHGTYQRTLNVL